MSLLEWQSQLSRVWLMPNPPQLCEMTSLQGLPGKHLALYEELLQNTVQDTLESIYPYTFQLLGKNEKKHRTWARLTDDYRRACPNASYKLTGAVEAFPRYLAAQPELMAIYPFLSDLALYEWLDMVALNLPDAPEPASLPGALPPMDELAAYAPVWNTARCLHRFEFHVPAILEALQVIGFKWSGKSKNVAYQPQPVDILIYRDPETLSSRFFCLNALTALLLQLSGSGTVSYADALQRLQQAIPALQALPEPVILQQAMGLFQNCLEKGILSGSRQLTI